ncbi:hypothetical protein Ahy_A06g025939 isoform A [Arachis hypogaea]|uniref:PB1-like domain-containing protein n=1 Tax=Arachis hypogaea TaxID=3818 RepID=A0A445CJ10_ARAHY|nr:hypothetical protein Ahy_A06g025939 isoform A [Arachis hypogaea]
MSNNLYCLPESAERRAFVVVVELSLENVVDVSGLKVMLSKTWKWMLLMGEVKRKWMYQLQRFRKCVVHDMLRVTRRVDDSLVPVLAGQNDVVLGHTRTTSFFKGQIGETTPFYLGSQFDIQVSSYSIEITPYPISSARFYEGNPSIPPSTLCRLITLSILVGDIDHESGCEGSWFNTQLIKMLEDVILVFHHGGSFVRDNKGVLVERFSLIDVDLICFFDLKKLFLDLGYHDYKAMYWYDPTSETLESGLHPIHGDKEIRALQKNKIQNEDTDEFYIYFDHPILEGVEEILSDSDEGARR